MKFKSVLLLFVGISICLSISIDATQKCACTQLFEYDCYRATQCVWNNHQLRCEMRGNSDDTTQTQVDTNSSYCSKFTSDKCWSIDGCAYIINQCVQFTACSSYPFGLQELCSMVSSKCVTDGEKCVDLGYCYQYQTNVSCVKDLNAEFCYWDQILGCLEAKDCDKLPVTFSADSQCREQLSYCTVNPRGGCVASGQNCEDQKYEIQCYFNQNMGQCAWLEGQCLDKSCATAPISMKTEKDCTEYFPGCTLASSDGGCRQRGQCNDILLAGSCTVNANGKECFWSQNVCYDKICENAPTGTTCNTFLSTCVPSANKGCMSIGDCSKYDLEESCKVNAKNEGCYWLGTYCVLHTCSNAPLEFNTHEQCANYKSDCTINNVTLKGCSERTCDNAPTTSTTFLATNYDCSQYKAGCITKLGGGCTVLRECSNIDVDVACIVDKAGNNCFFYNGFCKLRTCENAPLTYSTHQQCQEFNSQCTVALSLLGCVRMNCAVLTSPETCKSDFNGNRCYWTGLCYVKTCANAPFDYSSNQQCKTYLNTCTLANSGRGCITRPTSCSMMVLEDQCYITLSGSICGWYQGACYDKACFTAPQNSDFDSYEECDDYLTGCTVANDGNGGCVLLDTCITYTASRSCRYNASGQICEWTVSGCYDKGCTTAPQDADHDTNDECNTYLAGCIVAPSGQGCVLKPNTCGQMSTSTQCTNTSTNSVGGPCVWTGTCVDRTCANAPVSTNYDTHDECYQFLPTCTVVASGTGGCMTQYGACGSYVNFRSCQLASSGQKCAWQYNSCQSRVCSYAPDSSDFDSNTECSTFTSTCTVVKRTGGSGCTVRYGSCQDLTEHQCVNSSGGTLCAWNTTLATPRCQNRTCTLINGFTGTYTQVVCQDWYSSCVVDNSNPHTGCMYTQSNCSSYNNVDNCLFTTGGYCTWNGSSCVTRNCTTVQNVSVYNHSNCKAWLSSCTVNAPTSCYIKPTNCADYTDYDKCYKNISDFPCAWVNGACIEKTCTNHGYSVTTFNQTNCNGWLSSCSVNPGSTACETTRTCANSTGPFTHSDCQAWKSTCTVNGGSTACIDKTCTNYGGNVTLFNSGNCSTWLPECTNDSTTACKSNRSCTNYGSSVTVFNHSNCTAWLATCTTNNTACTDRTCTNYGQNIIVFTHANCTAWLSSCTVSWDGQSCEAKSCTNYGAQVTTFDNTNCSGWLSTCQANINATACESTLTCPGGSYTSVVNCNNYMESCTYISGSACTNKVCISPAGISVYTHRTCTNFYNQCTSTASSCQWRTCYNHGGLVLNFTHDACEQWLFQCTVNASATGCKVKTCTNHGSKVTTFDNANCNKWHPSCNGNGTICVESRVCTSATAGYTYYHTNCEAWSLSCTQNTTSACMTKTCAKATNAILTFTHASCTEWLGSCTTNTAFSACTSRTCTNYGINIASISHANCSAWLSTCTANISGTACETRTCYNYGSQVSTFDNTNCNAWFTGCIATAGTACTEPNSKCSSYSGTFNHTNCKNYLSTCTNSGSTACIIRPCSLASQGGYTYFNYANCSTWYKECTANSDASGCQDRTCTNYGDNVTTFTNATCGAWLYGCTVNSTNDACVNTRTCTNYGTYLNEFTHAICSHWLNTCTANGGATACIDRTCANHGANVSTFNYTNCNAWLAGCTGDGSDCVSHTCDNANSYLTVYTEANCYAWYSYCSVNDSFNACISNRTCTNHGSNVSTFDHATCNTWLSSCTVNSGGTACETKTCSNTNITTFNLANCSTWLSSCVANSGATGCESTKSCANGASNITTAISDTSCHSWLSTCTVTSAGTGCETKTCSNAPQGLALGNGNYYDANCRGWIITCVAAIGSDGCETQTCANASNFNTVDSSFDCTAWKQSCELNGTQDACQDKTCSAFSGSLSWGNCQGYLGTCIYYGNYDNTSACISTARTCGDATAQNSGYGITNQAGCNAYLSNCAYVGSGYGCTTRTCSNYVSANGSSPSANSHCTNWISTCVYDSGTHTCVERTCSNITTSVSGYSDCNTWLSTCTNKSDNSGCEEKTCANYSNYQAYFRDSVCSAWNSKCKANAARDACVADCATASVTFDYAHCSAWDASCSVNSGGSACEAKSCTNAHTTFDHPNCTSWLGTCTNDSTTACKNRTCYNYLTNILTFTSSNCSTWLPECTNYSTLGCTNKTCDNFSGTVSDANCSAYLSYCVANVSLTKCITFRTCTNHGSAVTTFNHQNCQNWLSTCTNNSGSTACEEKLCSNVKLSVVVQYNSYTCAAWKSTCIVSGSSCIEKTCSNSSLSGSSVTPANCSAWLPYCRANNGTWPQYCDLKTCLNHSITTFTHANCSAWLSYCTVNSLGTACYTERNCSNYGINIKLFNHLNCEAWLTGCTVNSGNNGCINKTCFNTNLSTFNDQTCGQWLSTCKANSSYTGCDLRTCTNYGNGLATFTSTTCSYWLYQCTNSGSTTCTTTRTCTNYSDKLQKFTLQTCPEYLSNCVPDSTNSSCTSRTCDNAIEFTAYTHTTCTNWLNTCTVNGTNNSCISRTCANASLTSYTYSSCNGWLSTCTVNSTNDGCAAPTCSNSVVTTYSQANCTAWLSTCTNGTNACLDKTCTNYSGTYTTANCQAWLPYCYANTALTACYSLRTCYNSNISTFNVVNCSAWLPNCTVNSTNDGCTDKTCYNTNLTKFSHNNCSGWLSTCTVNMDSTGCEIRSCTNHGSNIIAFSNANCAAWWKYCKMTTLSNACEPYTCWSTNVATFNHTNCYNYLDQCTVNSSTSCGSTRTCTNHGNVITTFNHANCQWWLTKCTVNSAGSACEEMTCTNHGVQVTQFTHNNCQNWMFQCTVNVGATDCELKTCSNYGANVVVYTHANCLAWLSTCTANTTGSECIDKTCLNTTGISTWSQANCAAWLSTCQLGSASTCASNVSDCTLATYNQCSKDTNGDDCVWYQGSCKNRACTNFTGVFTHANCENWLSSCTVNTSDTACATKPTNCTTGGVVQNQCVVSNSGTLCAWVGSACVVRLCSHFSGTFNHSNCQDWLSTCTVNSGSTACQTKSASCSTYTAEPQCQITSGSTLCFWINSACVNRTCDHAVQTTAYDSDQECKDFLSTCTVARIGGCMDKLSTCASYYQQSQCFNNISGVKCYWNSATSICSDAICTNAPTSLVTHQNCQDFINTCTVNTAGGCIPLAACTTYTTQLSCVISDVSDTCEWQSGHCYIKACTTASIDNTHDTHEECQDYMPNCTVAATGAGGCVPLNDCNTYTTERQCKINTAGQLCGWNGLICANRACSTAPATVVYSNDTACSDYMAGCTVVQEGYGCLPRKATCAEYLNSRQCVHSLTEQCYWNVELPIPVCETRTCFNAPSNSLTPVLCEQHLNTCYSNMQYCRLEVCEDMLFKTDFECKYFNSTCTTDGTKCVVRTKCQDVKNPAGCVMDDLLNECEWHNSSCVLKTCFTAPGFTTEEECNYYKKGCTARLFGGCQPKSLCSEVSIQAACTTSIVGDICVWDAGFCRVQRCEDFDGSYDEICNSQKQGCVSNGSQCILPRTCAQIQQKDQCVKGTDGPCTWYDLGCTLFLSCNSVVSEKDSVCKSANKLCTTNGLNCVGLDQCSTYRIKEACKTGVDGDCQWYENGDQSRCFVFKQCKDLPYLTHQECYQTSNKCTTDYQNGCINLMKCFQYVVKEQCKVSLEGQLQNTSKQITRTGHCAWVNDRCRDQICEDISGQVHESCAAGLIGCTTNGQNCITMIKCQEYTNLMACNLAKGTDGQCIYSSTGCRALECTDIKNGTNHQVCQNFSSDCISDGVKCIPQTKCEFYNNQYSCTFAGIDGNCAWNGQLCSLMQSCEDAKVDMIACQRSGDRCNWTSNNDVTSCLPQTCSSKGVLNTCNYVMNFNGTEIETCSQHNELCVSVDPSKLSNSQCYISTLGIYYWNTLTNTCDQCIPTVNNTNTNTTAVSFGFIVPIILLEIMLF